jgi:replicative DNA helicase
MNTKDEAERLSGILEKQKLGEILLLSEAARLQAQDTSNKISSGFDELDGCMDGGFREGDFTIISGVPGDGKTTLARMFTLNFGKNNIPCLWFSHEMSIRELWDSFEKMGAQPELLSYVPIELEDDIDWMFTHIDVAIAKFGIKAVFIDTLGDIVKSVKRQQELSNYATYLAQICKDLRQYAIKKNIMIFAVAHATKQTRSRTNETDNSDIANSNGIPAAATNIFHIWRDNESDSRSFVKIGKSRRDGTKKNWKFKYQFVDYKLIPEGRHESAAGENDLWRKS